MGIQNRFIDKKIRKSITEVRKLKETSVTMRLQKILILVDEATNFNFEKFRALTRKMHLDTANFTFLTYKDKRSSFNEFRGAVIIQNEINWQGKITSQEVKKILDNSYDLFIDFTQANNIFKQLIVAQAKSSLKAGFIHEKQDLYDFMIDVPPSDVDAFINELVRYLEILKLL